MLTLLQEEADKVRRQMADDDTQKAVKQQRRADQAAAGESSWHKAWRNPRDWWMFRANGDVRQWACMACGTETNATKKQCRHCERSWYQNAEWVPKDKRELYPQMQ